MSAYHARRYDTGQPVSFTIRNGRIADIRPLDAAAASPPGAVPSARALPWLAPGLVDLQVNGYGGADFTDAQLTIEAVERIALAMVRHGVTSMLATVTTHAFETLRHSLATIARACDQSSAVAARIAGVHLEGPYISRDDGPRGAHPLEHCRPPAWDEFQRLQEAAGGRIRVVTLSPEYDEADRFIARAVRSGVVAAIGHTAATSDQIRRAADAGARMSTHLGNGAHAVLPRHPNYIWDQLAEDRLTASLIADGFHLPPAVLKTFVRAKGPERCVLVSDITGLGGLPPGRYERPGWAPVEILEDGRMVMAGQRRLLAGAALPLLRGLANAVRFAEVDLKTAVAMASVQPATLIGLDDHGRLEPGAPANLVLLDEDASSGQLQVRATISGGAVVGGRPGDAVADEKRPMRNDQ